MLSMEDESDTLDLPRTARPLKRPRSSFSDVNTSSDPIFSSDGPEPSVEDYDVNATKKRRFKGSWWDNGRPSRRIGISRKIDSGIYIGSDGLDDNLPDNYFESSPERDMKDDLLPLSEAQSRSLPDSEIAELPLRSSQQSIPLSQQLSANLEHLRRNVLHCVENNIESIDLSILALETIPDHLLEPLGQIIRIPRVKDRAPSPELYEPFAPAVKLILSGNRLRSVPSAIFDLEHLTVLSLRGNKLTELPGSISRLHNLTELNVANNRLRWLPYELLSLLREHQKLEHLTVHPNPFLQGLPQPRVDVTQGLEYPITDVELHRLGDNIRSRSSNHNVQDNDSRLLWILQVYEQHRKRRFPQNRSDDGENRERMQWVEPLYVSKSSVAFHNPDGSLASRSAPASGLIPLTNTIFPASVEGTVALPPTGVTASSVPSLFEIALQACSASPFFPTIQALLPEDVPESVFRGLHIAADRKGQDREACTMCGRRYYIRRTEWIEYWHLKRGIRLNAWDQLFLPFLRHGCSWKCMG